LPSEIKRPDSIKKCGSPNRNDLLKIKPIQIVVVDKIPDDGPDVLGQVWDDVRNPSTFTTPICRDYAMSLLFCPTAFVADNHLRLFFDRLDYFGGNNLKLRLKVSTVIGRWRHSTL